MLSRLSIRDIVLIERLDIDFAAGLSVLTGETGAGKTLLVESIELLVGGRSDPILVRPGAAEATVEGRFVVDDDEIVLGVRLTKDGQIVSERLKS